MNPVGLFRFRLSDVETDPLRFRDVPAALSWQDRLAAALDTRTSTIDREPGPAQSTHRGRG